MNGASSPGIEAPPAPEQDQLAWLLLRLGSRSIAYFGAMAQELGLPMPLAMALQWIEPARPRPMNELAGSMRCDPSYVTWIADQLEAHGLAERRLAPHDRRVKELVLTEAGIARREGLLRGLAQFPPALTPLARSESSTLRDLLARLLGNDESTVLDQCPMFNVRHRGEQRQPAVNCPRDLPASEG
ncbi:MAG: winged helix-turn-helix transcriptional regulator [Chloroflexia bacterium]|nr:winged helix-turn-helix transcriptional regulator [Chloroflexia bacterium]